MSLAANALTAVVALLHTWFLILEMFLWKKPLGRKAFRLSAEDAEKTAVLAGNQGLYNGFLVAGLVVGLCAQDAAIGRAFRIFFLACVIVAGIYGGITVNRKIFAIQALPGALALVCTWFAQA